MVCCVYLRGWNVASAEEILDFLNENSISKK